MENASSFKPNDARLMGNQYGIGNKGGCPRTVSPSPEEMIELGKEMVAWVKENKPIHIKQWYCIEKMILYNTWKTYIQRPEFIPYYEIAMGLVSLNYINGTINASIAQRFIRVYFKDVKNEEDDTALFLQQLKADESNNISKEHIDGMEAVLKLMKTRQSSDRKIADSTNSNESKS